MTLLALSAVAFLLAVLPAGQFWANRRLYRPPPPADAADPPAAVSVLIPARNEERGIVACVESVLASQGVDLEVIVLDDHSTDQTAALVRGVASRDSRVRVEPAPPLPAGWCGKQHACWALSQLARHDRLAFLDADVRLAPDALARAVAFQRASGAALVSGFPRQETGTVLEKLLIPLIHFVLLGFLPVGRMRASNHPAFGAGCGQFFLADRIAYDAAGGHAAIRASLHDGVTLPRAFRRAGFKTDLFDATGVATCRMYCTAGETWRGLAKNATEGMASPRAIVPWTVLLVGGQVLPPVLAVVAFWGAVGGPPRWPVVAAAGLCFAATALSYCVRLAAASRFKQSFFGAALHPAGVAVLVALQWYALLRQLVGRPAAWKGRAYAAVPSGS